MKTTIQCLALILLLATPRLGAQNFAINWFSIDGGGGTSTGGVFAVLGTLGQPNAGHMSGGQFTVDVGFLGLTAAVQTPGAPVLSVERAGPGVRVFWPLPATGFVLEESLALASPPTAIPWALVPVATYQTNATHVSVMAAPPSGRKYYRLRKP